MGYLVETTHAKEHLPLFTQDEKDEIAQLANRLHEILHTEPASSSPLSEEHQSGDVDCTICDSLYYLKEIRELMED